MTLNILFETADWMVIAKPSGVHSVRGKDSQRPNIETLICETRPAQKILPDAGLVHRLDFLTSGCLMAAKSKSAYAHWKDAFRQSNGVTKTYLAISEGEPQQESFRLYFASRYKSSKKVRVSESGNLRNVGECRWKVLATSHDYSLLEVVLLGPGKRHQIRAGFACLSHPLCGDEIYGAKASEIFGLHSWKLKIEERLIECPPPATWKSQFPRFFEF